MTVRTKVYASCLAGVLLVLSGCGSDDDQSMTSAQEMPAPGVVGDGRLYEILVQYKEAYELPALGAVVVQNGAVVEKTETGVRQIGKSTAVAADDRWAIGSVTKSMTATLAGIFVNQGLLDWDTTPLDVFPELASSMQVAYQSVNVVELLSHSGGVPVDSDDVWEEYMDNALSKIEQRYNLARDVLEYADAEYPKDTGRFEYSNLNYVIVGAMMERISGQPIEDLMQEYLFNPLDMESSKVAIEGQSDEIWGHQGSASGWVAVNPGVDGADVNALAAAAGSRTYATLENMGKYLAEHLKAKRGESNTLMAGDVYQKLYQPVVSVDDDLDYALGWFTEGSYGLQHSGSDGRWESLAFVNTDTNSAFFISTNASSETAQLAVFMLAKDLAERTTQSFGVPY